MTSKAPAPNISFYLLPLGFGNKEEGALTLYGQVSFQCYLSHLDSQHQQMFKDNFQELEE